MKKILFLTVIIIMPGKKIKVKKKYKVKNYKEKYINRNILRISEVI